LGDRRNVINRRQCARAQATLCSATAFFLFGFSLCTVLAAAGQSSQPDGFPALPDALKPKTPPALPAAGTCQVRNQGGAVATTAATRAISVAGYTPSPGQPIQSSIPCPIYVPIVNWYARFLDGPKVKPLTPKEKAWLAIRNVGDPFNAITILGISAITIASDSHSPYGPGMHGFARNVGVSYAQDMTSEFFNTFLIPTVTHEDPHYHREPGASIRHRIFHCVAQVIWTQGDNGRGMLNYSDLVGFAIDDEVNNLYVPGRSTNLRASATRYAIGLATAPSDNAITEFLPDLARHIHVQVVLVQRIINQVAKTEAGPGG
jgi:hypothetical protein